MSEKIWKIKDAFYIFEDGWKICGVITDISTLGYTVKWADGTETIEEKPDPAGRSWYRIKS